MTGPNSRLWSSPTGQWACLCFSLVLLGGIIGWNRYQDRVQIEGREQERLLAQARIVQNILGRGLVSLHSILGSQGQEWSKRKDDKDASVRLQVLDNALDGVRTLFILDARGVCRAASRPELLDRNLSEREYFKSSKERPDPDLLHVSPPFRSVLGVYIITVSRVIFGPDGKFAGLIAASLNPEFFTPLLASVLTAPEMRGTIAHGSGRLFLAAPDGIGLVDMDLNQPGTIFRRHMDSGRDSGVIRGRLAFTGENGFWGACTVKTPGVRTSNPLVVTIGRNPHAILTGWRNETLFQSTLYVLTLLASCVTLYLYQKRRKAYDLRIAGATQALEDKARFIKAVADGVPGMVGYWNEQLRCEFANRAYLEWFGKTQEQMLGISIQELMGEELFRKNESFIQAALWGEPQRFERTLKKPDGSIGHTLARYIPDERDGRVRGFFVLVSDISELKETQRELEARIQELNAQATTDVLTGIANRRNFLERAQVELARSGRYGLPLFFLMLDIDHFKSVNDTYGHSVGDEVLKHLARTLHHVLRTTDVVGRLGGEEFGVLLVQTAEDEAKLVAERLLKAVEASVVDIEGETIRYTVSIGLAEGARSENSVDELMKRADLALYNAKDTGRNRVCCFGEFETPR